MNKEEKNCIVLSRRKVTELVTAKVKRRRKLKLSDYSGSQKKEAGMEVSDEFFQIEEAGQGIQGTYEDADSAKLVNNEAEEYNVYTVHTFF